MSSPAGENAPETHDGATDDDSAQQALVDAAATAAEEQAEEDQLDPKAKAKIEKVNREAKALRQRLRELEPLAKQARDAADKEKTEAQRLTEQLAERDVQLAELSAAAVRRDAAEAAGLEPRFAQFITAVDANDALEQAQELAKAIGANRPPDLRQGNRGTTVPTKGSPDDLIRRMAGH